MVRARRPLRLASAAPAAGSERGSHFGASVTVPGAEAAAARARAAFALRARREPPNARIIWGVGHCLPVPGHTQESKVVFYLIPKTAAGALHASAVRF